MQNKRGVGQVQAFRLLHPPFFFSPKNTHRTPDPVGEKIGKVARLAARTFLNRAELPKSRLDSPSRTDTAYPPLPTWFEHP